MAGAACFNWPHIRRDALGAAPRYWLAAERLAFQAYFARTVAWYAGMQRVFEVYCPLTGAVFDLLGITQDGIEMPGRRRAIHICTTGVDAAVDPKAPELQGRLWAERNAPSTRGKHHIVAAKVEKEVLAHRFICMDRKPEGAGIVRVSLKPKNAMDPAYDEMVPDFNRMVVDCSYNGQHPGMHSHAHRGRFADWIQFATFAMLICIIYEISKRFKGEEIRVAVVDIAAAYRSMDMNKWQRRLLMMRLWCFKSRADANLPPSKRAMLDSLQYVLDLAAAFGGRWSGYSMYELVCGAVWIFEKVLAPSVGLEVGTAVATDDFVVAGTATQCGQGMELLGWLLHAIGWKTEGKVHPDVKEALDVAQAHTVWTGVGVDVTDPTDCFLWVPPSYWAKYGPGMRAWAEGVLAASVKVGQSMQGRGFWLLAMMPGMASHIQPIINYVKAASIVERSREEHVGAGEHAQRVQRATEAEEASREAMKLMVELIPRMMGRGHPMMHDDAFTRPFDIGIFSDSTRGSDDGTTPPGFGVMVCGHYVVMEWPRKAIERATNPESGEVDNTILEKMARGIAIWLASKLWPKGIERRTVAVFNGCDNQACVHAAQRGRSSNQVTNDILRGLDTMAAVTGWRVEEEGNPGGTWLPTKWMLFTDALSRSLGTSSKALRAQADFREEVGDRPLRCIMLDPNSPLFDWSDPRAIVRLETSVPPISHAFVRAWQPSPDHRGTAQGYLTGVPQTDWRLRRGRDIIAGLPHRQGMGWVDGFPLSWTMRHSAIGSRSRCCGHSEGDVCATGAAKAPPTSTSGTSNNCTTTSSTNPLRWGTETGRNGEDRCDSVGRGPQTELELRRGSSWLLPRPGEYGSRVGSEGAARRSTSVSLEQWRWLGSLPCGERSTPASPGPEPAHFNFTGDVYASSGVVAGDASQRTRNVPTVRCASTGNAVGGDRPNGCLCTLRVTQTYVDSLEYES